MFSFFSKLFSKCNEDKLESKIELLELENKQLRDKLNWLKSLNIPFADISEFKQFDWINFVEDKNKELQRQVNYLLSELEKRDKIIFYYQELEHLYLSEFDKMRKKCNKVDLDKHTERWIKEVSSFNSEDISATNIGDNVTECKKDIRKSQEEVSSDNNKGSQDNGVPKTLKELRERINQIDLRV